MKSLLYTLCIVLALFACRKQVPQPLETSGNSIIAVSYLAAVKNYLFLHLPDTLYKKLDTTRSILTVDKPDWYFRIGFVGRPLEQQFILLTTDSAGSVLDAKMIELDRDRSDARVFNGRIRTGKLSGETTLDSKITNGYVEAWQHASSGEVCGFSTTGLEDSKYKVLAAVIVYPGYNADEAFDLYVSLGLLGGGGGSDGGESGSMTYALGSGPSKTKPVKPATITVETSYTKPTINVKSFMICFSQVPDAGASYSVNLFVDLPVNDDPSQVFNIASGAIGHVFLGMTKANGAQSVTQYIGFTTTQPMAAVAGTASLPGKVVDNGGHKFNGSMGIPVSGGQFTTAINTLQGLSGSAYNLADFNCVDFALSVINSFRPIDPVLPVMITPPGATQPQGTPEGLYMSLQNMESAGVPGVITGSVWNAGASHGACN